MKKYSSLDLWLKRRCCPNKILEWNWKNSESFNATRLNHGPWGKEIPTAVYADSNDFRTTASIWIELSFPLAACARKISCFLVCVCVRALCTHTSTTHRIGIDCIVCVQSGRCNEAQVCVLIRVSIFLSFRPCAGMRFESRSSCISSRQPNIASHIQSSNIWIAYSRTSHCLESDFFYHLSTITRVKESIEHHDWLREGAGTTAIKTSETTTQPFGWHQWRRWPNSIVDRRWTANTKTNHR